MSAASNRALSRRTLLGGALALAGSTLAACASPRGARERIVELASGREVSMPELLVALRASDVALLGERHDNALHHQRRGELIAQLPAGAAVVAEQLPRGAGRIAFDHGVRAGLEAAGFDAKGWRWPLHEGLFDAIARAGVPLYGGNLPREQIRGVVREGKAAVPDDLRAWLREAPLSAAAQAALDADLIEGHCGQVPEGMLAGLRLAQRVRDAAMASALQASGGHPAVLVAGDGHVRLDYGVPTLLRARMPGVRLVSVGFVDGTELPPAALYTHAWVTAAPPQREDACAGVPPIKAPASG